MSNPSAQIVQKLWSYCNPACGTGGFLLAAHDHIVGTHRNLTREQKTHLKLNALRGFELDGAGKSSALAQLRPSSSTPS